MEPADELLNDQASLELDADPMRLNMGPSHPAMHGTIHMRLALDGEKIARAEVNIGYLHRGFEKLMERRTFIQNFTVVCRIAVPEPRG